MFLLTISYRKLWNLRKRKQTIQYYGIHVHTQGIDLFSSTTGSIIESLIVRY